jgi:hypothetical protein
MLVRLLKELARPSPGEPAKEAPAPDSSIPRVVNVGGGNKAIPIPAHYNGWMHLLLDIDPAVRPDVLHDARRLTELESGQFDAVYCSHNLEHYYLHDGKKVLAGFRHVLKPHGFAEIRVPDIGALMKRCVTLGLDIEDTLFESGAGAIQVHDVIYGWGKQIETSGSDFYAHKSGFTPKSLGRFLLEAGFGTVLVQERPEICEISALAFMQEPTEQQRRLLNL